MTNEESKPIEAASERGSAALNDGLGAWIKCSENLPDIKTIVLVFRDDGHVDMADRAFGRFGWGWHNSKFRNLAQKKITHWMPLPKPPAA
jgi:hypothetical protein